MNRAALLFLVVTPVGCHSTPREPQGDRALHGEQVTLVIENVTLVQSRTGSKKPGVTILVAGERIYREVITLSRVVGLSHSGVAGSMECSEGATRVLLHRALVELADVLKRS